MNRPKQALQEKCDEFGWMEVNSMFKIVLHIIDFEINLKLKI